VSSAQLDIATQTSRAGLPQANPGRRLPAREVRKGAYWGIDTKHPRDYGLADAAAGAGPRRRIRELAGMRTPLNDFSDEEKKKKKKKKTKKKNRAGSSNWGICGV
jgi:hypothetical protein